MSDIGIYIIYKQQHEQPIKKGVLWLCVQSVDMLITQKGIQSMKKENLEPNWDELRQEREIQKGIEKQEKEQQNKYKTMSPEEAEAIADNNPDDGSWVGR